MTENNSLQLILIGLDEIATLNGYDLTHVLIVILNSTFTIGELTQFRQTSHPI